MPAAITTPPAAITGPGPAKRGATLDPRSLRTGRAATNAHGALARYTDAGASRVIHGARYADAAAFRTMLDRLVRAAGG